MGKTYTHIREFVAPALEIKPSAKGVHIFPDEWRQFVTYKDEFTKMLVEDRHLNTFFSKVYYLSDDTIFTVTRAANVYFSKFTFENRKKSFTLQYSQLRALLNMIMSVSDAVVELESQLKTLREAEKKVGTVGGPSLVDLAVDTEAGNLDGPLVVDVTDAGDDILVISAEEEEMGTASGGGGTANAGDDRLPCPGCLLGDPSQKNHDCMMDPQFYYPVY